MAQHCVTEQALTKQGKLTWAEHFATMAMLLWVPAAPCLELAPMFQNSTTLY